MLIAPAKYDRGPYVPVSAAAGEFLESYVHARAWKPWGKPPICAAALGPDAGLLGAVPLLEEQC